MFRKATIAVSAMMLVGGMAGAADAAACRDAKGKFIKCAKAAAPVKAAKCRDAKGKFIKCK